jgi:hypothetical protein
MVRATKDCVVRCGALRVDRNFNDAEAECLSNHIIQLYKEKCTVFHAGSASTHMRFLINYAETVHI